MTVPLSDVDLDTPVTVEHIGGERAFRRRLMEMGLVPGTQVIKIHIAPLGDPMELQVRGGRLSIRRHDAETLAVSIPEGRAKAR